MNEARLREIEEWHRVGQRYLPNFHDKVGELLDALRDAKRRECPGLEEHDALQHMTTRALRAEAEVERLREENAARTKERDILARESLLLRTAIEMVLKDTHKLTRDDDVLMWAVHDVSVTGLRVALDTAEAVRPSDG